MAEASMSGSSTSSANSERIGRPGEDVLALAFAGGGFDTVMQLGVIHALLVSDGRPPDVVTGISAGAVNAAALTAILQADKDLGSEASQDERLAARVARFREVLDAYQQSPGHLYQSLFPDPYEVEFHKPLQPITLPIHHARERTDREELSRERSGLIALINDLLAIRIPVRIITQAVRRVLGLVASVEERSWKKRWLTRIRHVLGLWWMWFKHVFQVASLMRILLRSLWGAVERRLPWLTAIGGRSGSTAGSIILGSRLSRAVGRLLWGGTSVAVSLVLWLTPPALLLLPLLGAGFLAAWTAALLLLPLLVLLLRRLPEILLRRYNLLDSLASAHPLRQLFVQMFDRHYYGKTDLKEMLEAALTDKSSVAEEKEAQPRTLRQFSDHGTLLAPVAADIKSGRLSVLHPDTPVVDALLASMAVSPLFPARKLKGRDGRETYFIDGINVANEPTSVLMDLLREEIHEEATRVRVFAVSSLPVSRSTLADSGRQYQGLIPVVQRVLDLKRFRDAYLERQLTELHTRVADLYVRKTGKQDRACLSIGTEKVLRADIYSIEPDEPTYLNQRLARAKDVDDRRRMVLEAVADGCRSGLETMIQPSISRRMLPGPVSCWSAVRSRLGADPRLPGSEPSYGPGVVEVCQACALNRGEQAARPSLRFLESRTRSAWPRRGERPRRLELPAQRTAAKTDCASQTPRIALLFSGGVFRGVFQMGSIAALSELDAKPQIFAGASVGSITAAMAARLFKKSGETARTEGIALLASTYLALDKLVLTDRFADFVRRFTLRAGAAQFSIADADRFFRRYDQGTAQGLTGAARRVVAGLERLFYLTPFELLGLLRAMRGGETSEVLRQLGESVQDFLDRFEVGQEALGSEPLALLIAHHVLSGEDLQETFSKFTEGKTTLLAVATNLTKGALEVLPGLDTPSVDPAEQAVLLESLLASSAFPAVFRPRWSWEVFPRSSEICQYVDGGVMDNLPLDAVVQYLNRQVLNHGLAARPVSSGEHVPHLLFAASLETKLFPPSDLERVARNWLALRARARQLGYNRKIDGFRAAQKRFRTVYEAIKEDPEPGEWQPLDIEVVTVKPEWLCGTFGFHPMLGFRRKRQAQNIAHGCAMTLGTLYALQTQQKKWFQEWGMKSLLDGDNAIDPKAVEIRDKAELEVQLHPQPRGSEGKKRGECWFRSGASCPFSEERTKQLGEAVSERLRKELAQIYELCGQKTTHQPYPGAGRLYNID
jgi:predicted acylesterase/phospholipase RssA